ncbi:MAG: respiratory nitrate reductase subunit gamma [Granulosicoccus sp.]
MFDTALGIAYSAALLWLLIGTLFRTSIWIRSRSRFLIPLAPAPRSSAGVAGRLVLELFAFRSLARANKTTWLASLAFHYGLLWLLIVHLRFVFETLPLFLILFIQFSGWASLCFMVGLSVLLLRRFVVDRLRYISSPSDYLHLLLLLAIGLSGIVLKRIWPTSLHEVGEFFRGVLTFSWAQIPNHAGLVLHLMLVLVLLLVFPVSKLVHGVGVVFSPTFNQRDRT